MAETQSEKKKGGLTRSKAVLIGVLSVVLVAILYIQFGSAGDEASSEAATYAPRRQPGAPPAVATPERTDTATAPTQPNNEVEISAVIDPTRWKSPAIDSVIAHDPFALPVSFPQPSKVVIDPNMEASGDAEATAADNAKKLAEAVEQLQTKLDELKQRGVHVIIRDRDQYAAMIGDRMVHIGEEIDGFVIKSIGPDGVKVEGKVTQ